jgi:hypothetical protein
MGPSTTPNSQPPEMSEAMNSNNRYTAAHLSPAGPGDARPTALQIIHDESLLNALPSAVFLITGTSTGLGLETAKALAATGATIYCLARDTSKTKAGLAGIEGKFEHIAVELSSLASVRAAAAEFLRRSGGRLNVLIANAGVMMVPERRLTEDGFEMHFGVNHLGTLFKFPPLPPHIICKLLSNNPHHPIHIDPFLDQ